MDAAWEVVKHWSLRERELLRHAVPELALKAPVPGGGTVRDLAERLLDIAADGLRERAELNAAGDNGGGRASPR